MTMDDAPWAGESNVVGSILDRIKATAKVDLVYGEERIIGNKTIVPVAAVAYTFGGGSGGGTGPSHNGHGGELAAGGGGGGGGAVRVQPVGVLEITDDQTRLVPIFDYTRIITTAITAGAIYLVFRTIFRRH